MTKIKKILLAVCFIAVNVNILKATDLYVNDNGASGAYSSIKSAIEAASSGDNIYIFPKSNGEFYDELTPQNGVPQGVHVLSAVQGQRFKYRVHAAFYLRTNSLISNGEIDAMGGFIPEEGARVINCKILLEESPIVSWGGIFENDSITSVMAFPKVGISIHGTKTRISGCYINCTFSGTAITNVIQNSYSLDSTFIIGNRIIGSVVFNDLSHSVFIYNNLISTQEHSSIGFNSDYSQGADFAKIEILNNTLSGEIISIGVNKNFNIKNNLFLIVDAFEAVYLNNSQNSTISYNYVNLSNNVESTFAFAHGFTNDGTNVISSNTTIDSQGHLMSGSDAINGGDPDSQYLDLDLTRNDVGCYGGSFSLSNFNNTGIGGPHVLFMNLPRKITSNQSISIMADGIAN